MTTDSTATPSTKSRRTSNAVKGAASYTIAGLLGKGMGFLMLPLYTRALTPADYGRLTLVTSICAMASILLTFGFDSPFIRIYFEFSGKPEKQDALIQSLWRFLLVSSSVGCILVGCAALAVLGTSTAATLNGPDVLLGMMATGLGIAATGVTLPALRAGERFSAYLTIMAASAASAAVAAAILVLALRTGVLGALSAGIIANIVVLAIAFRIVPWKTSLKTDRTLIVRSLRMGIPLVPHFASMQALVVADRLILVGLVSASSLGLFGLASNIALPAMVACQAITQATMPTYAQVGTGFSVDGKGVLRNLVTMQIAAITFVTAATALLGPPLIGVLASKEFSGAAPLTGWIALGYGFLGLYGIPMNGATIGAGRTSRAWIATLTGAISNIALIFLLTPEIGIEGAAIASAGGYLVLLLAICLWAHARPNPVSYDVRRVTSIFTLGAATFVCGSVLDVGGDVADLATRSIFLIALLVLLAAITGALSTAGATITRWRATETH